MEMAHSKFDVVVIGAGPGGCTFAILAAQAGLRVGLVEKELFPRFRIGESLLPENVPLLKRLGLFETVSNSAQKKPGAVFSNQNTDFSRRISFANAFEAKAPHAFQVDRELFDQQMLDRAIEAGVQVFQPWSAGSVIKEEDRVVGVEIRNGAEKQILSSHVLVDATGRSVYLGKQLGKITRDPVLNQVSTFSYFDRITYLPISEQGDIEIIQTDTAWIWVIPLRPDKISVGAVWTKDQIQNRPADMTEMYESVLAGSAMVQARLAGAKRITPTQTVADFSYDVDPKYGNGWVTVGDAAAFVDPVFSSGVFLTTLSAERAFDLALPFLHSGQSPPIHVWASYERWLKKGLKGFKQYIYGYYTPGFKKVFYSDPPFNFLKRAVASNLAGNVFEPAWWVRCCTAFFWFNIGRENKKIQKMIEEEAT